MTTTEQYSIHEVIQMIEGGEIRIPILQRRYVWNENQVVDLFESLLNDNPFGSISAIKTTDDYQMFASRTFFDDLKDRYELSEFDNRQEHNKNNPLYLIIDGQQRLQSFYLGLTSKFDDGELCFDKNSGYFICLDKFYFKYYNKLSNNAYIPVKQLYNKLVKDSYDCVAKAFNPTNSDKVNKNIFKFYYHIFFQKRIVILLVYPGKINVKEDRTKHFELFKKLNTAGVNLDIYDICVSKLKALNPKMEELFFKLERHFEHIDSYPFDMPFKYQNSGNYFYKKDDKVLTQIWLKIICCCYRVLPFHRGNCENSMEKTVDYILKSTETNFNIDLLFEFVCNVFKIFRIITLPKPITYLFINDMYERFTANCNDISLETYLIEFMVSSYKHFFYDEKSLRLFSVKYLLYLFKRYSTKEPYEFVCFVRENSIYEIKCDGENATQGMCNDNNTKRFGINRHCDIIRYYDRDNKYAFYLKYNDNLIDKEFEECLKIFRNNWQFREKQIVQLYHIK